MPPEKPPTFWSPSLSGNRYLGTLRDPESGLTWIDEREPNPEILAFQAFFSEQVTCTFDRDDFKAQIDEVLHDRHDCLLIAIAGCEDWAIANCHTANVQHALVGSPCRVVIKMNNYNTTRHQRQKTR